MLQEYARVPRRAAADGARRRGRAGGPARLRAGGGGGAALLRVQELPGGHVRGDVRRPRHQRRRGVQGRRRRPLLLLRPAAETLRRRRRLRRPARSLIRSGKDGRLINIYQAADFFLMMIYYISV